MEMSYDKEEDFDVPGMYAHFVDCGIISKSVSKKPTNCKICMKQIEKDAVRFIASYPNRAIDSGKESKYYNTFRHIPCLLKENSLFLRRIFHLYNTMDAIPGCKELIELDMINYLEKTLNTFDDEIEN